MDKKQLIINLISNVVAFSSSFIISFFLTPYLITHIGKDAYSFFPMSNNILGYFSIASLALNSMIARFITIEREKGNFAKAQIYFSSGFYSNIIMALVFLIPMIMFTVYVDRILNVPVEILKDVQLLFACVFAAMLIGLASTVYGVATFAANRLDLRALGELIRGLLRIGLFVGLFYFFKPSLYIIGLVSLILSVYLFVYHKYLSGLLTPEFTVSLSDFDISAIKDLLTSGSWNVINAIGMSLLLSLTLILTNKFIGSEQGGEVAIALILPTFVGSIISMIVSVLLPRLTKVYATGNNLSFHKEVVFSQKLLSLLTTTPIALLIIFGKDFFSLWLPDENIALLPILSIIFLLPLFIHANIWTIYNVNIIRNKMKYPSLYLLLTGGISAIFSVGYALTGGSNIIVIPLITTVCSVVYYFLYIPLYVVKTSKINIFSIYVNIIKSLLLTFVFINASLYIKESLYVDGWLELFVLMSVFGIVGFVMHLLVLFSISDVKNTLKKNTY